MSISSNKSVPEGEWFRSWFEHPAYLELYEHRNDDEAARVVRTIINLIPSETSNQIANQTAGQITDNYRVLDSACGSGRHSKHLSNAFPFVVGIDLSSFLLKQAQKQSATTHFVRGNLKNLPFASESFSLITSLFTSFGYFPDDKDNKDLLHQWSLLLKSGGTLILDLPNPTYLRKFLVPKSSKVTKLYRFEEKRWIDETTKRVIKEIKIQNINNRSESFEFTESVRLFEKDEMLELLSEAGFEVKLPIMGNYTGDEFDYNNSDRMIFSARKIQR